MNKEKDGEELRAYASELAARVRYLREEIEEGRQKGSSELVSKVHQLVKLFPVDPGVATINFEIFDSVENDTAQTGGESQQYCLRIVQIGNPGKKDGATEVKTISLLPPFRENDQNLSEYYCPVSVKG